MPTFSEIPDGDDLPISATLYVTYRRCPQQALARLQGIYQPPSRASFKGALAHRLFARHLERGPIPAADFDRVCREETGANLNQQLSGVGLRPSEFRSVVSEVEELYRRFAAFPVDGFMEAEASFETDVGAGVHLRGRLDAVFAVDGGERIVDWKTGTRLEGDAEAQVGFYALAWRKLHGSPPVASEAVSVVTGEAVGVSVSEAAIDRTEDEIASMVVALREAMVIEGELDRTAGPHCAWCPLLDDCSEGRSASELLG